MALKPLSFPEANLGNVMKKLMGASAACGSAEEFMVKMVKTLDKADKGMVSYDCMVAGFKE